MRINFLNAAKLTSLYYYYYCYACHYYLRYTHAIYCILSFSFNESFKFHEFKLHDMFQFICIRCTIHNIIILPLMAFIISIDSKLRIVFVLVNCADWRVWVVIYVLLIFLYSNETGKGSHLINGLVWCCYWLAKAYKKVFQKVNLKLAIASVDRLKFKIWAPYKYTRIRITCNTTKNSLPFRKIDQRGLLFLLAKTSITR